MVSFSQRTCPSEHEVLASSSAALAVAFFWFLFQNNRQYPEGPFARTKSFGRPTELFDSRTMIAIPGTTKIANAEANFAARKTGGRRPTRPKWFHSSLPPSSPKQWAGIPSRSQAEQNSIDHRPQWFCCEIRYPSTWVWGDFRLGWLACGAACAVFAMIQLLQGKMRMISTIEWLIEHP